jgi:hypothetical protein
MHAQGTLQLMYYPSVIEVRQTQESWKGGEDGEGDVSGEGEVWRGGEGEVEGAKTVDENERAQWEGKEEVQA